MTEMTAMTITTIGQQKINKVTMTIEITVIIQATMKVGIITKVAIIELTTYTTTQETVHKTNKEIIVDSGTTKTDVCGIKTKITRTITRFKQGPVSSSKYQWTFSLIYI